MTWLSRLLTQNTSLQHRAPSSRIRENKRRRRMVALEYLENRLLLTGQAGNVNVVYNPATLGLAITGDNFNDAIRVAEASQDNGGAVTVTGILSPLGVTTINGAATPFTTPGAVKAVTVNFNTGGTVNNFDKLILTGAGKTVATTVTTFTISVGVANLGLSVGGPTAAPGGGGVDNAGAFTLTTSGNINGPGTTPAQINNPTFVTGPATIDNSTFPSLSITQTSPTCVALVELGADTIGPVSVSLGDGPGDSITVDSIAGVPNVFGPTTLREGNGAGDVVTVGPLATSPVTRVQSLVISQGNGNGDNINVQSVTVTSPIGVGVSTTQGDGNNDVTVINNVIVGITIPPFNIPGNPTSLAGISVAQGNGNSDLATVSNSTVDGNITVTQGNGTTDSATVTNDTLVVNPFVAGNIRVTQGNGNQDTALVNASTLPGNISIVQGNGGPTTTTGTTGDTATVSNDTILTNPLGVLGNITVTQGNGSFDKATVSGSTAQGNITIFQGNGNNDSATVLNDTVGSVVILPPNDDEGVPVLRGGNVSITQGNGNNDSATVDPTTINGNLTITQGNGNADTALVTTDTVGSVNVVNGITTILGGLVAITQGNGNSDSATVSSSTMADSVTISQGTGNNDTVLVTKDTIGGNLTISQTDGVADTVTVTGTRAGSVVLVNGFPTEVAGNVTITQGNGASDAVVMGSTAGTPVTSDVVNNVTITQGNASVGGTAGQGSGGGTVGDTVSINDYTITSNISITQGTQGVAAGNYSVVIGATSAVTAGGFTVINQAGAGNFVGLGTDGAGNVSSFVTSFLDIFTGSGGGAFVLAQNTTVLIGVAGFFGAFAIEGGGISNIYLDLGGNTGVNADPAFFDTIQFP